MPFEILEKNPEVGGTWYDNTYPGCRVDNPNHLYSYSFEADHAWRSISRRRTSCSPISGRREA